MTEADMVWVAGDQAGPADMERLGLVAIVKVSTEGGVASGFVDAIIDTGASTSCIDTTLAASIGLTAEGFAEHHVIGGGLSRIPLARCAIGFQGGAIFRDLLQVGLADLEGQCAVLIGRDVLAHGRLLADFRSGVWALYMDRHKVISSA